MTNFRIEYSNPWFLLLLIPAVLLTLWPYFRSAKKYRRTRNRILSMAFHLVALVLAINLLSGIKFSYEVPNLENEVILLVDSSDSNGEKKQDKDDFIASVINVCDDQYRIGIVKFGFDQKYVAPLTENSSEAFDKYLTSEDPDVTATDIASALKYASTLFTNPKSAKIVLISDGIETDSAAASVIKGIVSDGIKVDTVHFPNEEHDELQIVDVQIPTQEIAVGEEFVVDLILKSNLGTAEHMIKLTAYDGEEAVGEAEVPVKGEESKLQIALALEKRGLHELTFKVETEEDTLTANNEYHTFINLAIFENILIVERTEGEGKSLADFLAPTYKVVTMSLDEDAEVIPRAVEDFVDFEQVILVNVAYGDMPAGFEESLNDYVYRLGGGLLTLGGENDSVNGVPVAHAYNRNDIANSIYLKDMLPVHAIDYTPPVAIMLVIDASASMSSGRLEAAIMGAEACLGSLHDRDFCGVMSFQTRAQEEIQVLPVTERETILEAIRSVDDVDSGAQGGTIFSDAIMRAGHALSVIENVERKHIIMVTDGNPGDSYETYLPYIEDNRSEHITMSVIAVDDIDSSLREKMQKTADAGGGAFYSLKANEYDKIPEIMQEDLGNNAIVEIYEEEFVPTVKDRTSITAGVDPTKIPPLMGYYGTVAKQGATVALAGEYVPIYAEWQYGKGTVGSFMSDLTGIWSNEFITSPVGQSIVHNIINSVFPTEDVRIDSIEYVLKTDNLTNQLTVYGALEGENIEVQVTPVSNSLASKLEEGVAVSVAEANRRYKFALKDAGIYRIKIKRTDATGKALPDIVFYKAFSYSEEYNAFPEREPLGRELLSLIAKDGKGMEIDDPAGVFENFAKTLKKEFDPRDIFLIVCIVSLLLDVAVRKFKFKWPHELIREHKQKKLERSQNS
ncbi:MAG: VWA domain-containing protein [Clostridia bacterium]|nr:VWA domain-containing protein [Clostridia bacterium]